MACPMGYGNTSTESLEAETSAVPVSILGFETTNQNFLPQISPRSQTKKLPNYGDYIATTALLQLQDGPAPTKEGGTGLVHHEERTFIVVHQVFELWFKLVLGDVAKVQKMLTGLTEVASVEMHQRLAQSLNYLQRIEKIFTHMQGSFEVLETMHPADFLEFRDYLVPASGFQSTQFRELEMMLGLQETRRRFVNERPVFSYLDEEAQKRLRELARSPSVNEQLIHLLNAVNVPDSFVPMFFDATESLAKERQYVFARIKPGDPYAEQQIREHVDRIKHIILTPDASSSSHANFTAEQFQRALVAALYVCSYRHDPQCELLAQLMDHLIAVEEGLLLWRSRHLHLVERMIGRRDGTGGSSGVDYLDATRQYRVFDVVWLLRKVFIRSSILKPFREVHGDQNLFKAPAASATPTNE
eukprot:PhM_4_TR13615/c0_g1_i1/m.9428/K00453/TDO2, kynA; tryptophan 2,3-dioxygenase